MPIGPTGGSGGSEHLVVITAGIALEAGADPSQAQARSAGPARPLRRPVHLRTDGVEQARERYVAVGWSARGSRASGSILVAQGGSLIMAKEVPSVGAVQAWISDSGGRTSLDEVGPALLQDAEL